MNRDEILKSYREQLEKKGEMYFLHTFNMRKQTVVDPNYDWNLNDLRERTIKCSSAIFGNDIGYEIELIHAGIWAKTFVLLLSLHNLIVQIQRDGGVPNDDERVLDYEAAINLVALQYGVLFVLEPDAKFHWILFHDENLRLHNQMGGSMPKSDTEFVYDVALSFAGENRSYVQEVAKELKQNRRRVFYDEFEKAKLWGKDLYQYLNEVYKQKSRLCVVFISKYYAEKLWTSHELKSMQTRAFLENKEYILPVRFDETQLPGLNETVAYVNAKDLPPAELAKLICQKLNIL